MKKLKTWVTGMCELERLSQKPDSLAPLQIAKSIMSSTAFTQEEKSFLLQFSCPKNFSPFQNDSSSPQTSESHPIWTISDSILYLIMKKKKIINVDAFKKNFMTNLDFLSPVSMGLEYINYRSSIPVDNKNPMHQPKIAELWIVYFPEQPECCSWEHLGFQGNDPTTDFRSLGILGLDLLIWIATKYPSLAQKMLGESNGRVCKSFLSHHLDLEHIVNGLGSPTLRFFPDMSVKYRCFCWSNLTLSREFLEGERKKLKHCRKKSYQQLENTTSRRRKERRNQVESLASVTPSRTHNRSESNRKTVSEVTPSMLQSTRKQSTAFDEPVTDKKEEILYSPVRVSGETGSVRRINVPPPLEEPTTQENNEQNSHSSPAQRISPGVTTPFPQTPMSESNRIRRENTSQCSPFEADGRNLSMKTIEFAPYFYAVVILNVAGWMKKWFNEHEIHITKYFLDCKEFDHIQSTFLDITTFAVAALHEYWTLIVQPNSPMDFPYVANQFHQIFPSILPSKIETIRQKLSSANRAAFFEGYGIASKDARAFSPIKTLRMKRKPINSDLFSNNYEGFLEKEEEEALKAHTGLSVEDEKSGEDVISMELQKQEASASDEKGWLPRANLSSDVTTISPHEKDTTKNDASTEEGKQEIKDDHTFIQTLPSIVIDSYYQKEKTDLVKRKKRKKLRKCNKHYDTFDDDNSVSVLSDPSLSPSISPAPNLNDISESPPRKKQVQFDSKMKKKKK